MTIKLVSSAAGNSVPAPANAAMSVALRDKLERCTRQLGDWEACTSSKTPEGKKIIQNLRAQIGNLESRINAQAVVAEGQTASTEPGSKSVSPVLSTLGSLVNAFA